MRDGTQHDDMASIFLQVMNKVKDSGQKVKSMRSDVAKACGHGGPSKIECCGFAWFKEALHFALTIDLHVSEKFDERRLIDFVMRGLFEAPCERRLINFVLEWYPFLSKHKHLLDDARSCRIMSHMAVVAFIDDHLGKCQVYALQSALVEECHSRGERAVFDGLRSMLASPNPDDTPLPEAETAANASFLARLKCCASNDRATLKSELYKITRHACTCLEYAMAEVLIAGSKFCKSKAQAARQVAKDPAGAIVLYAECAGMLKEAAAALMMEIRASTPKDKTRCRGELDEEAAKVYSNLSMLHLRLKDAGAALACADCGVAASTGWFKTHARRGEALSVLGRHQEAADAFSNASSCCARTPEHAGHVPEFERKTQSAQRLADQNPA
mmetsp:Transcript_4318/g.7359  ORF Transcript_4318/g.7359 Transcript_4318/m.7359 type:complete len:386 (-) Transcript_4318:313-1470(-)|eukprot:CAMPEP_0198221346 /NCGR_PEP_ID=MMETSP1445-20131203/83303_1 /TAXON_ID=36898 /ORGANISM="Pyramimonas sp., Strain CCMP2087" /LENGTH=385 /DNA_ID=CAMNT_0043899471 /DNA_START=131 /DNA_END=1288 /DNA_ORIENTATION=+